MKKIFTRSLLIPVLFLFFHQLSAGQGIYTIRGIVADASNGDLLAAANIRVLGTSKGTITNTQGRYSLSLETGTHTLIFSYLAYQPETLIVNLTESTIKDIKLKPTPIQMPEFLVLAEDPAIEIIRKAIANKQSWMNKLKSYKFDAFSRQVVKRDTAIASITESYSTGYMLIGDTLREVVKQKRQTENIPGTENFAAVHRIINFNDDEIKLFNVGINRKSTSFSFVGPTAPDALDYYDYKLTGTSVVNGLEIYKIKMIPKSRLRPLFDGIITIAEGTFAVMGVDVKPNETFTFPFVKDIDLHYKQQFGLFDSLFWMPIDNRISGGLSVSIVGITMPRFGIEATSSIYDYEINIPIPDTLLKKPRLVVDSSSIKFDSTFWAQNEVLPLTTEEQTAYKSLDSTQTLDKQFKPSGPLMSLSGDGAGALFKYVDARFNRVEGFFFGGRYELDTLTNFLSLNTSGGYGFSDKRFKYEAGGSVYPTRDRKLQIGGSYYLKLDNVQDGGYYSPFTISLMALIDKNDYRDYFLTKGWKTFMQCDPLRTLSATLNFFDEEHSSMTNKVTRGLFSQQKSFRANPPVNTGNLRSLQFDFRFGDKPVPLEMVPRDAFEFSVEYSSPKLLKSDFKFTRYSFNIDYNINTFAQSLLFPPLLKLKISGGIGNGTLPPQRIFVLDSRASGYAPFGVLKGGGIKEFGGDRFININIEHNFRSTPFLALNLPYFYRNGIEVILHASFAQTWLGTATTSSGWYSEAGIGVSKIFDVLRADLTYRFKEQKRFYFTLSVANIF